MKIKATSAFITYDAGKPVIARKGSVHIVSEELAKSLVNAEMAELIDELKEEKKAVRKPTTRKAAKVEK